MEPPAAPAPLVTPAPPPAMSRTVQAALSLVVLVVALGGAWALVAAKKEPERSERPTPAPLVRVMDITLEDVALAVSAHGSVAPRTETRLVSQVAGQVRSVSPSLSAGGFFARGEVLASIDARDYELAVVTARAQVAQADARLQREQAEAEAAREEWRAVRDDEPPPLVARQPQVQEAEASLAAARAALERAELDLERTSIRAPYAGRVRAKLADVGQYLTPGTPVADVYAVDYAEIRLPVPDRELAFLDLDLDAPGSGRRAARGGPAVEIRTRFAGAERRWAGEIVRVEGEVDARSRMVHLVARVPDPYAREEGARNAGAREGGADEHPPLAVGMFVEATIAGRTARDVVVLPRSAVRDDDRVFVVEEIGAGADGEPAEGTLRFRPVEVLRAGAETVVIAGGLAAGDRVVVSPVATPVDGMRVRVEG